MEGFMGFETRMVRLKVGVRLSRGKHYGGRVRAGLRLWWVILAFTVQLRERRGNSSQAVKQCQIGTIQCVDMATFGGLYWHLQYS